MKLSLRWLKQFVNIPENLTAQDLSNLITLHTAEVDGYENPAENFANMVIGKIIELHPHPNADKLQVCVVSIGETNTNKDSQNALDLRQNSKSETSRTNGTESDFWDFNEKDDTFSESCKKVKIVCGGTNLYPNQLVAVALPGSKVRWHGEGDLITLEATTIRGENSYGMICASDEIGMGPSSKSEIMDLTHLDLPAGTPLAEALNKTDIIFDIDNKAITHRPDLWSHYGFARELAAITGSELKNYPIPEVTIPTSGQEIKLEIQNPEILKQWNSVIVDNIQIQESPAWLKQKLEAIGARPINNIVDITNLVMYEFGQPMHAYDKQLLQDLDLEIRFAKDNETLETLDHKQRKLTNQDPILVTKKDQKPVIILGIMGGANSEVSESTTSILLESACFDPVIIRKSSTNHALRSDASQRFEKSLDPNQCLPALLKALSLIKELQPEAQISGPITQKIISEYPELKLNLDPKKVSNYIGVELPDQQIKEILESLEFKVEGSDPMQVTVPSFRATKDIQQEADLIEEVVRIYGYEKIEEILPTLPTKSPILNIARKREHQARDILTGFGLSEVLNYSFYSESELEKSLLDKSEHLLLQNYLSEDQTHLRTSLVINMLKTGRENLKNFEQIKIFEIGRTYSEIGQFFPSEQEKIAILISGTTNPFFDLKGILEAFLEKYSQEKLQIIAANQTPAYLHPKKAIQIVNEDNQEIGFAGIIHPLVQENFDYSKETAYAEINLRQLAHQIAHAKLFEPISKFPGIQFDISVVVPNTIFAKQIEEAILKSSDLITQTELFDIYEGQNLKANHKALAYKIYLQSKERTLTEKDLAEVQENCINNLKNIGGTIRGYE